MNRLLFVAAVLIFASATTQSTVQGATTQSQSIAKSAAGTIQKDMKLEIGDMQKILTALLKAILGEANYKKLMAAVGQIMKQVQGLAAQAQAGAKKAEAGIQQAVGGIAKQMQGGSKPAMTVPFMELAAATATTPTTAQVTSAANQANGKAVGGIEAVIKMLEGVLKQILGDANYKKMMALINQLVGEVAKAAAQLQAGAKSSSDKLMAQLQPIIKQVGATLQKDSNAIAKSAGVNAATTKPLATAQELADIVEDMEF